MTGREGGDRLAVLAVPPEYRAAVNTPLVLTLVLSILMALILDGGRIALVGQATTIGFWSGAAIMIARRPTTPRRSDLIYLRWGYPALLIAAELVVARWQGWWPWMPIR